MGAVGASALQLLHQQGVNSSTKFELVPGTRVQKLHTSKSKVFITACTHDCWLLLLFPTCAAWSRSPPAQNAPG